MASRFTTNELKALRNLFVKYRHDSKRKNRQFKLGFHYFVKIITGNCYYCGTEPVSLYRRYELRVLYNGIDRVNSSVGYITGNSVPCCFLCNQMKTNFSVDVFLRQVGAVALFFLKKK